MELKQVKRSGARPAALLLIVPYGIETWEGHRKAFAGDLLIVPYGIETKKESETTETESLLIVPYGIETKK